MRKMLWTLKSCVRNCQGRAGAFVGLCSCQLRVENFVVVCGLLFLAASCRELLLSFVLLRVGCRGESEIDTWVGREVLGGAAGLVLLC